MRCWISCRKYARPTPPRATTASHNSTSPKPSPSPPWRCAAAPDTIQPGRRAASDGRGVTMGPARWPTNPMARARARKTMSTKTAEKSIREEWTFEEFQQEADELRTKLNRFRTSLGRFFIKKQELIDLMVVAAVAQEPLLLVGPPGTAKSDLVLKFKDALGLGEGDYFEYMLTRFTEPSEIVGPIDIG